MRTIPIPVTVQGANSPSPSPPPNVYDSSDDLGERMKKYDEWIHTAQVKRLLYCGKKITDPSTKACRNMNNFSSAAAIVVALTSPTINVLALTSESKARPILHGLARELAPTDGSYQNTLRQATTRDLIPWLGNSLRLFISLPFHPDSCRPAPYHPQFDVCSQQSHR